VPLPHSRESHSRCLVACALLFWPIVAAAPGATLVGYASSWIVATTSIIAPPAIGSLCVVAVSLLRLQDRQLLSQPCIFREEVSLIRFEVLILRFESLIFGFEVLLPNESSLDFLPLTCHQLSQIDHLRTRAKDHLNSQRIPCKFMFQFRDDRLNSRLGKGCLDTNPYMWQEMFRGFTSARKSRKGRSS
jgi:hypothetical protein